MPALFEQVAYPILLGRQHPPGHPDYPRMGSFFDVQRGGGRYPDSPSPPSNHAAAEFLGKRVKLPAVAREAVEGKSVAAIMKSLTSLQVCLYKWWIVCLIGLVSF